MSYYDDALTRPGAEELARRLDDYWHARGWPLARHWVEPFRAGPESSPLYGVRSNLKNGNPPLHAELEMDENGRAMPDPDAMRQAWAGFRKGLALKNA